MTHPWTLLSQNLSSSNVWGLRDVVSYLDVWSEPQDMVLSKASEVHSWNTVWKVWFSLELSVVRQEERRSVGLMKHPCFNLFTLSWSGLFIGFDYHVGAVETLVFMGNVGCRGGISLCWFWWCFSFNLSLPSHPNIMHEQLWTSFNVSLFFLSFFSPHVSHSLCVTLIVPPSLCLFSVLGGVSSGGCTDMCAPPPCNVWIIAGVKWIWTCSQRWEVEKVRPADVCCAAEWSALKSAVSARPSGISAGEVESDFYFIFLKDFFEFALL